MIEIRSSDLRQLSEQLGRRKSHIETAMRRATGSFVALLKSHVIAEVRKKTGMPRSEMNRIRIRARVVRSRMEASLWVGANPIAVRYLSPRFTSKGIVAGGGENRRTYDRAFMPKKKQGNGLILQRVGKDRLPVEVPKVDINDIVLAVLDREWSHLERYFDARVAAELRLIDSKA
jgi:hypothetical protein